MKIKKIEISNSLWSQTIEKSHGVLAWTIKTHTASQYKTACQTIYRIAPLNDKLLTYVLMMMKDRQNTLCNIML